MESWDRPTLDATEWSSLFEGLAETEKIAAEYGLTQVVHPHVNTLIETADEFERFLRQLRRRCSASTPVISSSATPIRWPSPSSTATASGSCTSKMSTGRSPARFRAGEFDWMGAIQHGLFPSAGSGDAPIAATVRTLEQSGYTGWYVLEQDVALTDGEPPLGEGPVHGVRKSIEYLKSLAG